MVHWVVRSRVIHYKAFLAEFNQIYQMKVSVEKYNKLEKSNRLEKSKDLENTYFCTYICLTSLTRAKPKEKMTFPA